MARNPELIAAEVRSLLDPAVRGRLVARGNARAIVWRNGVVPSGAPPFASSLTDDLLDFGYGILALALELRDANSRAAQGAATFETGEALRTAAEAIEAAVRRGQPRDEARGFHLVVGAAAFHLAGFAARSFALLPTPRPSLNLSSAETALALLLRRELIRLRDHVSEWLSDSRHSDETVASRLGDVDDKFDLEDAVLVALTRNYQRALGLADTALYLGDRKILRLAQIALAETVEGTAEVGNVPLWWVATLSTHLLSDLWIQSLHQRLPTGPAPGLPPEWKLKRRDFIQALAARFPPQVDLWPSQLEAAARTIDKVDDLVVSLPTSAGKTRIAELCILRALTDGLRVVYVTPLRALSAQVELALARTFVPVGAVVTSLYGASGVTVSDAETLRTAEVVVATPEKLDFAIRQDPDLLDDVGLVVFDEGHMIGLGSREIRYEVLIQRLLRRRDASGRRLVCLSAMFNPGDDSFHDFTKWIRADAEGEAIHINWRPTRQRLAVLTWNGRTGRLEFVEDEKPYVPRFVELRPPVGRRRKPFPQDDREFCVAATNAFATDGHSILIYSPQRVQVEALVETFVVLSGQGYLEGVQAPAVEDLEMALAVGREWLGEDHPAFKGLKVGVGAHHGALPRPFLTAVEKLLDERKLPVVVASPTLAQGIDLSCSVLIFRSLTRFDSQANRQKPIKPTEFANVLGRAGRAYVDIDGISVCPIFDNERYRRPIFDKLVNESRSQVLWSGLVRLAWEISQLLAKRLGVGHAQLVEYVSNNAAVWDDPRVRASSGGEGAEDASRSFEEHVADLDVALFSLVDDLGASEEALAQMLDRVLARSLWARTIVRVDAKYQKPLRGILDGRVKWLWRNTTPSQRQDCFSAGLGQRAGVFLYDNFDRLFSLLSVFRKAVTEGRTDVLGRAAVAFCELVLEDEFFRPRNLGSYWRSSLASWVSGVSFAEIRHGDKQAQAFIQDTVIYKLVWAAEAVRVLARGRGMDDGEVGVADGPALVLTYGVPTVQAALLCQHGFASRVGAVWAASKLPSEFVDRTGLGLWLQRNRSELNASAFWQNSDQYLLWRRQQTIGNLWGMREWERVKVQASCRWLGGVPARGTRLRLIAKNESTVAICNDDLTPVGEAEFRANGGFLVGRIAANGKLEIEWFGPRRR